MLYNYFPFLYTLDQCFSMLPVQVTTSGNFKYWSLCLYRSAADFIKKFCSSEEEFADCVDCTLDSGRAIGAVQRSVVAAVGQLVGQWPALHRLHPVV